MGYLSRTILRKMHAVGGMPLLVAAVTLLFVLGASSLGHARDYEHRLTLTNPTPASDTRFGTCLAAVGGDILVGAPEDSTLAEGAGAAYLFDGTSGALLRTFFSPQAQAGGRFGKAVAVVEGKLLIGAPGESAEGLVAGAAYLFDGATGALLQTFHEPGLPRAREFGRAVAGVGGNALIGTTSSYAVPEEAKAAYLFSGTTGVLLHTLQPSGATSQWGRTVAAWGTDPLISDWQSAYRYDGVTGELRQTFTIPFGSGGIENLAKWGENLLVGLPYCTLTGPSLAGAVGLFEGASGDFMTTLSSPFPSWKQGFGGAVAALGDTVVVGAPSGYPQGPEGTPSPGSVCLFEGTTGAVVQVLGSPTPVYGGNFGAALATWGEVIVVGAPDESVEDTPSAGAVHLFGPPGHALSVSAAASAASIASGGTVALSASGADNEGHTGLAWSWSDGGAKGTFSPSATVPRPTYTASANTSGSDKTITLTVTGTCKWHWPWVAGSSGVMVTVQPTHALSVTNGCAPTSVDSGATVRLWATPADSKGHTGLAWQWTDQGAGGTFLPSANVSSPTYIAPVNPSAQAQTITLTVKGTCKWFWPWLTATSSTTLTVRVAHTLAVSASASAPRVVSGGTVTLSALGADSQGHTGLGWSWSDGGAGGTFSPSATVPRPTYTAPVNTSGSDKTITLVVTGTCKWRAPWVTGSNRVTLLVAPMP